MSQEAEQTCFFVSFDFRVHACAALCQVGLAYFEAPAGCSTFAFCSSPASTASTVFALHAAGLLQTSLTALLTTTALRPEQALSAASAPLAWPQASAPAAPGEAPAQSQLRYISGSPRRFDSSLRGQPSTKRACSCGQVGTGCQDFKRKARAGESNMHKLKSGHSNLLNPHETNVRQASNLLTTL